MTPRPPMPPSSELREVGLPSAAIKHCPRRTSSSALAQLAPAIGTFAVVVEVVQADAARLKLSSPIAGAAMRSRAAASAAASARARPTRCDGRVHRFCDARCARVLNEGVRLARRGRPRVRRLLSGVGRTIREMERSLSPSPFCPRYTSRRSDPDFGAVRVCNGRLGVTPGAADGHFSGSRDASSIGSVPYSHTPPASPYPRHSFPSSTPLTSHGHAAGGYALHTPRPLLCTPLAHSVLHRHPARCPPPAGGRRPSRPAHWGVTPQSMSSSQQSRSRPPGAPSAAP